MSGRPELDSQQKEIVAAASRCFEQFGIAKTTMSDVADAAGINRRALYRAFPNRQSLVDVVLDVRLTELVDDTLPLALSSDSFEDALVEVMVAGISYVQKTPDLGRLLREISVEEACQMLLGQNSELMQVTASLWRPILEWGRSRGEVRDDLVDEDFVEWLTAVTLIYCARKDVPRERLKQMLRGYMVPAASARHAPTAADRQLSSTGQGTPPR